MEVPAWIDGGSEPATISESNFSPDRLWTLRSRGAAAYKGFNALLKLMGGQDLRSGQPFEYTNFWDERVDIHHIFPQDWCKRQGIDRKDYDSIINKTPLSARTNRIIGARAPSAYLRDLEREAGISPEQMDALLRSHGVEPHLLRTDDFNRFMAARAEALLAMVERVTGKTIPRNQPPPEGEDMGEDLDEMLESIVADAV